MEKKFAQMAFDFTFKKEEFEQTLLELLESGDWTSTEWDNYDDSLELNECIPEMSLSKKALEFIFASGFDKVYLNHKDGWETLYTKHQGGPYSKFTRRSTGSSSE